MKKKKSLEKGRSEKVKISPGYLGEAQGGVKMKKRTTKSEKKKKKKDISKCSATTIKQTKCKLPATFGKFCYVHKDVETEKISDKKIKQYVDQLLAQISREVTIHVEHFMDQYQRNQAAKKLLVYENLVIKNSSIIDRIKLEIDKKTGRVVVQEESIDSGYYGDNYYPLFSLDSLKRYKLDPASLYGKIPPKVSKSKWIQQKTEKFQEALRRVLIREPFEKLTSALTSSLSSIEEKRAFWMAMGERVDEETALDFIMPLSLYWE